MRTNLKKQIALLLFLAGVFISCEKNDGNIDADIVFNTHYYWSGGKKIWLDTDLSTMIVKFDSEESLIDFCLPALLPSVQKLSTKHLLATVWQQPRLDNDMLQKLDSEKSIVSKIFGHRFHNSENIFWLTGDILLGPKANISAEDIMEKFEIDGEIVSVGFMVVIQINDLNLVFDIANAIYESGMVEWCHPDFFTIITHGF